MQYKTLKEILQANIQWYCYDGEQTPSDIARIYSEESNEVRSYVECLLDRKDAWQSIVTKDVKDLCSDTHLLLTKYRESYKWCVEDILLKVRAEIERHSKVLDLQTLDNATLYRMGVFYSRNTAEYSTREDAEVQCEQLRKEKKSFVVFHDCFKNVWVVIESKTDGQLQGSTNEDAAGGTNKPVEPQPPHITGSEYERKVYEQALKANYIQCEQGRWVWKSNKKLFGYFCGRLYCEDCIKYLDDDLLYYRGKGKITMPSDKLKEIWDIDVNNNRPRDKSEPPKKYYDIDMIFDKANK